MADIEDNLLDLDAPIDRLDELVSQLLDDSLADHEFAELEETLLASSEARKKYIGLMQLHVDLMDHFQQGDRPKSPVLGFLADSHPTITGLPRDATH